MLDNTCWLMKTSLVCVFVQILVPILVQVMKIPKQGVISTYHDA